MLHPYIKDLTSWASAANYPKVLRSFSRNFPPYSLPPHMNVSEREGVAALADVQGEDGPVGRDLRGNQHHPLGLLRVRVSHHIIGGLRI